MQYNEKKKICHALVWTQQVMIYCIVWFDVFYFMAIDL